MSRIVAVLAFCLLFLSGCSPSKPTYTIALDQQWTTLELMGLEDNVLAFSLELLTEIAKQEKLALAIVNKNWDDLVEGLDKQGYSAILSSIRPYSFYEKTYSFSDLYLATGPAIVTRLNSKINSMAGLRGKIVGVVQGSTSTTLLQTVPGVILQSFPNITHTLLGLRVQTVQAASIPILIAQRFVTDIYSDALKVVTPPLDDEGLRLITLHGSSPKLMTAFNRGLIRMRKSGQYQALLEKWGLAPGSKPPSRKVMKAFINRHLK